MNEEQINLFDPASIPVDHVLNELSPDLRTDPGSWPALLAELVDVVADHIETREKLNPEVATDKAQDLIMVIAHHLGGRAVYLPRNDKLKRAVRDSSIFRAFNGTNHLELAKKTGLTIGRIYVIIEAQRRLRDDRLQMKLPFQK